jgi:hypothetical protein
MGVSWILAETNRQDAIEGLWAAEDRAREADRAFTRARMLARYRRILSAVGFGRPSRIQEGACLTKEFKLAFDDIAGLYGVGDDLSLPVMPRRLAAAWREDYGRYAEAESFEPFNVRRSSGYWLLEGGMRELLRLELLRARGEAALSAKAVDGRSQAAPALRIRGREGERRLSAANG